jgi:proline iminopeptidase
MKTDGTPGEPFFGTGGDGRSKEMMDKRRAWWLPGGRAVLLFFVFWTWQATVRAEPAKPDGAGKTFESGGVTIWYEVRGSGSGLPLVVVNGGPGFDHRYLLVSNVWDRLAERRAVVMYDQRGNGRSSRLAAGQSCTLQDQVADLDRLRETLGQERIDLLGHSWGGYLVVAYAAAHPDRVAHLVILDAAAPKWSDTEFIFEYIYPETVERRSRLEARQALGDEQAGVEALAAYLSMLCVSAEKTQELLSFADPSSYTPAVNAALNADLADKDLWPLLPSFAMPTLVATGRFDINVAPSTAWKIHKAIPGSRFVVFERSGHLPFFEEPDEFLRAVQEFLDGE